MATGINESTIDAQYEEIEDGFLTVSKKAGKLREDILLWASSLGGKFYNFPHIVHADSFYSTLSLSLPVLSLKDMILRHTSVVNLFEELFDNSGANISHLKPSCSDSNNIPPILNLLFDYLHALQQVADKWKLTLTRIHDSVLPLFDELFATFKGPHLLMKKRDKKLLDFDRSKSLRIKGEEVYAVGCGQKLISLIPSVL